MPRVLVPLAEGFEELEAVTIVDLLRRAKFDVVTAGLIPGPVRASRGMVVVPDCTLDEAVNPPARADYDLVVLPGGQPGSTRLANDPRILGLLQAQQAGGRYVAAICAAPAVLARAGLLSGKRVTAYPGSLDAAALPDARIEDRAVVCDGRIITSRGPGTAMDFALMLIETLAGRDARDAVEHGLERPAAHLGAIQT